MIKKTLDKSINQKNINFFSENKDYQKNISEIDTYKILYEEITNRLKGRKKLLDIGHGGCFDYDNRVVNEIIGLDLDKMISAEKIPENVKLVLGSALNVPNNLKNFDTVIFVMLLHHLVGKNVKENLKNLNQCIAESRKTLLDDGKLIIVESCVPYWFYLIEMALFKPTSYIINKFIKHPPAFQFTKNKILEILKNNNFKDIKVKKIKQGKFILQYGFKFPTYLTPVETIIFEANK